jgi:hypothetical protein
VTFLLLVSISEGGIPNIRVDIYEGETGLQVHDHQKADKG